MTRIALACAMLLVCGVSAVAQTPPAAPTVSVPVVTDPVAAEEAAGLQLYRQVKATGAISPADASAIEAAAELNPAVLDVAATRATASQTQESLLASETALKAYVADLLDRARLQAVASDVVSVQPAMKSALAPFLGDILSAERRVHKLPAALAMQADTALRGKEFVLKPLCPAGTRKGFGLPQDCIPSPPWSEALFRSVVPIRINGQLACSGTAIGTHLVLTAAHCVIEQTGTNRTIMAASKISVGRRQGGVIALATIPKVPKEMLAGDCLPDCFDMRYDFAILETDPAQDGGWTPLPLLSRVAAPGDLPITIAGYGKSTLPASASSNGFFIGAQRLHLAATAGEFSWSYGYAGDLLSSSCSGDSGGPVFYGEPRKDGDSLALIGVISRTDLNDCFKTRAVAVNLTMPGPAKALCSMLPGANGFCGP